ncbi:coiled-coil domain-containing protein AGAP005037 isoform X2 [Sitophilus oryzae]|uniref:Coiled-coil domain-containing protein AGAP005037 isoform X2 n=1 Tax=Sitophilus oryzae TaxID=7048 RepID=A0A6J2X1D3_SITOR|nr:coiled-coil domain-containing protein AGAP005037 isoform X2 [Sitophilus oryzae]
MLIRWKNKDKDKDKCEKSSSSSGQKQGSSSTASKKKRKFGRDGEEEWNSDGKSGRGSDGTRSDNEGGEVRGRSRGTRRDDPRRHTLGAGSEGQYLASMAGQGGPLSRTMDLEGHHRGYLPPSNAMLFDDDPGIMSEVETSSTGFRRGGKQRSSLPVVRTPSKTLERPLVFLQYRNETKRALLPNEITSIDTVKALFVRSFPKQLTMEYLDSPNVKIYIHDSSKDMFYELEDLRSHLREIRDRSVLRLFESADVSGGLPMAGIGIAGGVGHFEDPSYFSEPEFDSEYQHQHIHKSKVAGKAAPYYMGSTSNLQRGAPFLRTYSPAVSNLPADRMKPLPTGAPPKPQRAYSGVGSGRNSADGPPRPPDRFAPFQRPANPLYVPDGYMSSPERSSRYEDPYYSQYGTRSGSITPVIDEEISDTELLDDSYSLYGVKVPPGAPPRTPRTGFPTPGAVPYDATRLRVENMERQLANLTGLVQKALTQPATLQVPTRDGYRGDEFDKNSSSSSASLPDDTYLRTDSKAPKLGKSGCHKSVSFEKSVSFSDEPPDMNSPKQHSPQHAADTKPTKPAIKSSTLPRTSSQERDRLKPAPPPKPASLSPGQYDSRIYRDLQLTPEMYNQLRGLQKKAKDLRAEVRNLRRMSQAQAHSVKETIRDTFIKIRAMLLAGGEQVWQAGMDQERVRLTREEDLYKQEMLRLEKDLGDLESTVEELRGNVINRKTRVNMSDVENMALILSKSSKTVADLKLRFPGLQDSMKALLTTEMDKMMREEKFLKEEPERLESALRRCKKLTGTLVTLKRLASVQEQRLPCSNSNSDSRLSPGAGDTPPVTPSSTHSKPPTAPRLGSLVLGGECSSASSDSSQRPENALDALLDELQTFSKPHPGTRSSSESSEPPAIPAKGVAPTSRPPQMAEIGRKGSMDSASFLPSNNLTVSTTTGSLRRLHSYPSGSDTDNSPPIQPLQPTKTASKPPIPERNTELLQHVVSGKRIPPPPPPRTSSKSPLASPTSPSLPPRSVASAGLQHIQNVQNMEKPMSQFEQATQNLGLQTLRRNVPNRSSIKDSNKSQTLPRNIGSNLQIPNSDSDVISASNSSSCESVNSQDGTKKTRKEELEQRHQELLKKQKALQEQYARLQQLQRGNNTLTVIPPAPDQLLKKTGSESNLLQKMGLQLATSQITGSLTNIPNTNASLVNKVTLTNATSDMDRENPSFDDKSNNATENKDVLNQEGQKKVYETDIL